MAGGSPEWVGAGGSWMLQEDRDGICVTSALQLAANDSLNHNISANSATGKRCEALNLLVGSRRLM